jgi:transcriptional regulator with XRE-family HTH domain
VEHKIEAAPHVYLATPEELAAREVRSLRKGRGWSQEELARRMSAAGFASWHQSTVGRTETGDRPLRLNEAVALSELFGVSLTRLLTPVEMTLEQVGQAIAETETVRDKLTGQLHAALSDFHEAQDRAHHHELQLGRINARLDSLQRVQQSLTGPEVDASAPRRTFYVRTPE